MKTASLPRIAFVLQKYENNLELVCLYLIAGGFASPSSADYRFARLIVAGAEHNGERLVFADCCGDSDLGSGWGG
jgi:hypothetical protein